MNLLPKDNPEEFNHFLLKKIDLNLFKYKFLKEYIKKVQQGSKILYDASLINISENGWILVLHGDILLIYGENWSKTQFSEIKKVFDLNKFTNYTIQGESNLTYELIDYFNVEKHNVRKERVFYKSNRIIEFAVKNYIIESAEMRDINQLSKMLQQYYREEYSGEKDKSIDEMQKRIFQLIQSENIILLKNSQGIIISFCTIINPDIGILFTKTEHRKNGYGKILLSHCSKLLKQTNSEVYVMTDKNMDASNKVCKAVGFEPFYENTMTEIN